MGRRTVACILLAAAAAAARTGEPEALVRGQVLVKVVPGGEEALDARLLELGVAPVRRPAFLPVAPGRIDRAGLARIHVVSVPEGREAVLADALRRSPSVAWAELNDTRGELASVGVPDDTEFPAQWTHDQASDIDMDLPEAWGMLGTFQPAPGFVVAVIDSGYERHSASIDMQDNAWTNPGEVANGLDDDGNGLVDDLWGWDWAYDDNDPSPGIGHGCLVASLLAAVADNATQIAGVTGGCTIMGLRAYNDDGKLPQSGPWAGKLAVAAAIQYATDQGARVINNSWTHGEQPSSLTNDAIDYAVDNGVHVFFAAGNANTDVQWPAQHGRVTAVAAIESDGTRMVIDPLVKSDYGPWVDVCNGGKDIVAIRKDGTLNTEFGGTSSACPLTAGVAVMLLSRDADLTPSDLRAVLQAGAVSVDAYNPNFVGLLGTGLVNAANSLRLLAPFTDLGQRLPGSSHPVLNAWGLTGAGDSITVSLSGAGEDLQPAVLVVGLSAADAPFKGGVLVPEADLHQTCVVGADGALLLTFDPLPAALPAGPVLWFQFVLPDAGAPAGFALSNALLVSG